MKLKDWLLEHPDEPTNEDEAPAVVGAVPGFFKTFDREKTTAYS